MGRKLTLAAGIAIGLTGCALEREVEVDVIETPAQGDAIGIIESQVDLITPAALADLERETQWLIDLRQPSAVALLHPALSDADLGRITLICPDQTQMQLISWIEQDPELETIFDENASAFIGVGADFDVVRNALPDPTARACERECYLCADGAWVCTNRCGAPNTDERTRDLPPVPPPGPGDSPPREPPGSPGGSGGSSGGSGRGGAPPSGGGSPGAHPGRP